jgi:hypothetical protein
VVKTAKPSASSEALHANTTERRIDATAARVIRTSMRMISTKPRARLPRIILLALLLCGACLGLAWDVLTVLEAIHQERQLGGDHLGMFFPMVGVLLFAPVQLAAALAFIAIIHRRRRSTSEIAARGLPESQVQVIDERAFDEELAALERSKAQGTVRAARLMLGVPGAAMAVCALCQISGLGHGVVQFLAGGLNLIWGLSWFGGVVAGGIALGRYDRWTPLALAPLYPVCGWFYTFA